MFPGIAVAREIARRSPASEILFVGAEQGIEARIVPKEGFQLRTLRLGGVKGVGVLRQAWNLWRMVKGFFAACGILRRFKPDAVIGVGGYASFPMLGAAILGGYLCSAAGSISRRFPIRARDPTLGSAASSRAIR
ncbi:MAG: glycosyltransferase [Acidobacteria bacterium]|nr:glycosyltransferase [Acidobacteriota bacterium]